MKTKHKTLVKRGTDAVVSIRIPKELLAVIQLKAKDEDRTLGSVMRRLLARGLQAEENDQRRVVSAPGVA